VDEDIKVTSDIDQDTVGNQDPSIEDPAKPSNDGTVLNETDLEIKEKITALEVQINESENRYLRLQADFTNFRRRVQKEKEDLLLSGNMELVKSLLPVMDSLEKAEEQGDAGTVQIFKQFTDILYKEGLAAVDALGKPFDPHFHQAIDQVECDKESGIIVDELRKGYTFKGVLIRPSVVRVAK